MPPPRVGARPMTQTEAYGAGRGLTLRLADPRRRRSRAVLLEPPLARKKQLVPAPEVPTATAAAPPGKSLGGECSSRALCGSIIL